MTNIEFYKSRRIIKRLIHVSNNDAVLVEFNDRLIFSLNYFSEAIVLVVVNEKNEKCSVKAYSEIRLVS